MAANAPPVATTEAPNPPALDSWGRGLKAGREVQDEMVRSREFGCCQARRARKGVRDFEAALDSALEGRQAGSERMRRAKNCDTLKRRTPRSEQRYASHPH